MDNKRKSLPSTDGLIESDKIPRYCVEAFPHVRKGQPAELKMKDEMGNVWTFYCCIQSSVNPRPVFCSGWLQFVRNKNLRDGDTIIRHKGADDATEALYSIEVRKTHDFQSYLYAIAHGGHTCYCLEHG